MKNYFLESCVTNHLDAINAANNGADRLEICSRLETEGMTPDIGLVKSILEKIKIPVRIMIRETEIGFEASDSILEKMISSILQLKNLPIDGFVLGLLKDNRVDRENMDILLNHAAPLPVTFHKAIDLSADKRNDIVWLNDCDQIDTILTSGGADRAVDGVQEILKMKAQFKRNIMAGGKITAEQLPTLHRLLQLNWYHGKRIC